MRTVHKSHLLQSNAGGGVGGGATLWTTLLSYSPFSAYNFDEASGDFIDSGSAGEDIEDANTNSLYRQWAGPDGVARARTDATSPSCFHASTITANVGFSLFMAFDPATTPAGNTTFFRYPVTLDSVRYDYDVTNGWSIILGRVSSSGTHFWRRETTPSSDITGLQCHLFTLTVNGTTADFVWFINGVSVVANTFTGPNGAWDKNISGTMQMFHGVNLPVLSCDQGPVAVWNSPIDSEAISAIFDVASSEGWF